jgi:hypothetical protein
VGTLSVACLSSSVDLSGLEPQQVYYVYYIDPAFAGGAIAPIATLNSADFVGKPGYYLIGSILTPAYGAPTYAPSACSSLGSMAVVTPGAAYDGNLATYATIFSYNLTVPLWSEGVFSGFPPVAVAAGQQLCVNASVTIVFGGDAEWAITASVGGGQKPAGQLGTLNPRGAWAALTAYAMWDTFTEGGVTYLVTTGYTSGSSFGSTDAANTCLVLASGTGAATQQVYSVPLAIGLNASAISVDVTTNLETSPLGKETLVYVYEIYVQ